ncbi:type VI secretion system tube protein Hcp [Siccirubricoccus sp. KC 17139]|uniref:Type VI secretion system tube protein Hcp n=1 Tax=Siccirubricoccus soli TaxID=2899147 RepID=A0ABT1D1K0_9PROT|nr:type VI secretion system tube protein Hcp [Siccirubricoccus soli]MCO6415517.1 type VI secretion system tube protein Hcp [Siccirubricoccus soli]MCP2681649.1 type VI secretion system tube protein Hcp [Siccirubricoccus soli]
MAFDAFMLFTPADTGKPLAGETQTDFTVGGDPFIADFKSTTPFEIDDFSFDIENVLNIGSSSSGVGAGKPTFNPFQFSRKIDIASPDFFRMCCSGKHFKDVVLALRKSTGGQSSGEVFLRFNFKLVGIKTVSWSGADGDEAVKEEVTFEYGSVQIQYKKQKPDGALESTSKDAGWDRIRNIQI